jgi:uncharacterized protein (TIGR02001 family)
LSFGDATVGFNFSDDYFASSGETTYVYVDYGFSLGENWSLGLHYGTISADDNVAYDEVFGDTVDDYSISLSTEVSGVGVDFSFIDSSGSGALDADAEFAVTISKSL